MAIRTPDHTRWRTLTDWDEVWQGSTAASRLRLRVTVADGRHAEEVGDWRRADQIYAAALAITRCKPVRPDDVRRFDALASGTRAYREAIVGALLDGCHQPGLFAHFSEGGYACR